MATVENRYAKALLSLSEENGNMRGDLEQALFIRDALDDAEIHAFLLHPQIPKSDKYELFRRNFSKNLDDPWIGFLHLMIRKNQVSRIVPVLTEYIDHANRHLGNIEAKIVSARELTQKQIGSIRAILEKKRNMRIQIRTAVDPDVIGGFYILMDGRVFDATIRSELNTMQGCLKRGGHCADEAR